MSDASLSIDEKSPAAPPDRAGYRRMTPAKGYGPINWLGLWTLCGREIQRFIKIYPQTITAPVIMSLLFLFVFGVTIGGDGASVGPVPFQTYIVPGLVMMAIAQNAFFNTSSSLILGKLQGHIVDLVMAPISPFEWTLAYTISGVVRGVVVGVATSLALWIFTPLHIVDWGFIAYHAVAGAMMLSLLGLILGIWADKFEQLATFQNFIIMPATFMSGTFFSTTQLSPFWAVFCQGNPFFYMIDGFRYGFTGVPDGSLMGGVLVMLGMNLLLFMIACLMIRSGSKLKN